MIINKISEVEFEIVIPQGPLIEKGTIDSLETRLEELQREKKQYEIELQSQSDNLIARINNLTSQISEIETKIIDVKAAGIISKKEWDILNPPTILDIP